VKHTQVEYQHAQREDVEENPEVEQEAPRRRLELEMPDFRFQIADFRSQNEKDSLRYQESEIYNLKSAITSAFLSCRSASRPTGRRL
jgi:hypothetical protein